MSSRQGPNIFDNEGALSREYLLDRGYCCESGCRNCPYEKPGKSRVLLSWSSGKDSAWTLHVLQQTPNVEVVGLLTTTNAAFDRVAMHGVRRELLEAQARALTLPINIIPLPWPCSNEQYELLMEDALDDALRQWNFTHLAFGDLFLEDIRRYREDKISRYTGLKPLFPLWKLPTAALAQSMLAAGLKARVVCVDPKQLDSSFAGREYDRQFLDDLPAGVDPCGENGEFHTFVYGGPMFKETIQVSSGEVVERDGFWFADLIPNHSS